jgi:hypothetical protein
MMWGYPIWLHANNHSGMRVDKPSAYKNPLGGEYYRIYWWKDFWYPQSSSYIDPWLTKPVWIKTFIFYGMFGMVVNFVTCIRNAVGEAPRKIFFLKIIITQNYCPWGLKPRWLDCTSTSLTKWVMPTSLKYTDFPPKF